MVQNRMENCHHDHIPSNVKGNGSIVSSVCPIFDETSQTSLSGQHVGGHG